jgi:EAL domain-containing protein (putative c-di-GMP-specific phosphodiesterase class I)/CheY-like chemotaxis protein
VRGDIPPSTAPRVGSVLIVDDSAVQRGHAAALCRSLAVSMVYEATSGAEALHLLSMLTLPPELLVVDLEMPEMDGVELIQALARLGHRIPLVVASSRELALIESVEALARDLDMPVVAALCKPLREPGLRAALERCATVTGSAAHDGASPAAAGLIPRALLADAIEAGVIDVHYQPKVDVRTAIVRGVEALARWNDPSLGTVGPDRFVACAERTGLIHALTASVVDTALAQAARWNAHGLRLSMAINLSPRVLAEPRLVDEIVDAARRHGVAPQQVVLEITESSVEDGAGDGLGTLARLRLKGFGLSIDDYGTGFSSMKQLARIPFTELKVDRSFVHGAHERTNLRVILQSALGMSRQLGLVTVAEGIETLEDWRLLQQCGCDIGQGFLLARPLPAADLPAWLRAHQARLPGLRA